MKDNSFRKRYGPWALVTGASGGIGEAFAEQLAKKGQNLILVARSHGKLESIADSLTTSHGIETRVIHADLGVSEDVDRVVAEVSGLDIGLFIANAGFGTAGPFADNDLDAETNMIDVNCRALAAMAHPIARSMRKRSGGGIVFLSSIVAFQGVAHSANYAATKAYVQTLAEGLAMELRPHNIDVLSSAPGPVATGFASRADMQMDGASSPVVVAKATLEALGRTGTTRPGFRAKLLGYGLGSLPRGARSLILSNIMKGMTKHRDAATKA